MNHTTTTAALDEELRQLVMDTRMGDQGAYDRLLRTLAPFLRRAALAQLNRFGRGGYAEDVVQETLLAVHLKLHTYDNALSFLAWVRVVLKHKIIDYLRRNRVTVTSIDDLEFWEPIDPHSPEDVMVKRDLQKLLDQLKPPIGAIIYGLKVQGASIKDLSAHHGVSESNIKVMVHRGLQKLSTLMREDIAA